MLLCKYAPQEAESKAPLGVSAERFRGDAGRSLVPIDSPRHDAARISDLQAIPLAPVLTEMVLWAARHENTANQALVRQMQKDKEQFLAEIRRRWAENTIHATGN